MRNSASSRSYLAIGCLLLAIGLCGPARAQQAGEEPAFTDATRLDTSDAWEKFIAAYPASTRLKTAYDALDTALTREAKTAKTANELASLYRRCHNAELCNDILTSWGNAAFKEASASGDRRALQQYLLSFPSGQNLTAARERLDDLAWETAQTADSIAGYQAYLALDYAKKHIKAAQEWIDDREWQAAQKTNSIAGYEAYLALKTTKTHITEANNYLAEAKYREALKANTIEALERLANSYNIKLTNEQRQDVTSRLRGAYYDRALKSGARTDWHAFLSKYQYQHDVGAAVPEMVAKAKLEEERLLAQDIKQAATAQLCEEYLHDYPNGKNTPLVLMSYEPILASALEKSKDVNAFERYTKLFPNGAHAKEVEVNYDQLVFANASAADWHSDLQNYIKRFPDGANVQKAKERLAFLKANKATVVSEFPATVQGNGRWAWKTVFKETEGKIGFRVSASGSIIDNKGHSWGTNGGSINRGPLTIKAGGSASDDYWCSSASGAFLGGYASFTWTGEDAGGHPIRIEAKVNLR